MHYPSNLGLTSITLSKIYYKAVIITAIVNLIVKRKLCVSIREVALHSCVPVFSSSDLSTLHYSMFFLITLFIFSFYSLIIRTGFQIRNYRAYEVKTYLDISSVNCNPDNHYHMHTVIPVWSTLSLVTKSYPVWNIDICTCTNDSRSNCCVTFFCSYEKGGMTILEISRACFLKRKKMHF